jgi:hypothetical protein
MTLKQLKIVAYNPEAKLNEEIILEKVMCFHYDGYIWLNEDMASIQINGTEKIIIQKFGNNHIEVFISRGF